MKRDYTLFLKDIVESCSYIREFIEAMSFEQFLQDEKTKSAVVRKFEIIGEAVKNLPSPLKEKYTELPWRDLAGMRDRLIHGYFGVDYVIVWETIQFALPVIQESLMIVMEKEKNEKNEY
jgi:uncharacterized protein with HEPN domain